MTTALKITHPVCSQCGSAEVKADAYAYWDHTNQCWDLVDAYDKGAHCEDCDGETRLDWIDGDPPAQEDAL